MLGLFLYSGHVIVLRGNVHPHQHDHVSSPLPCSWLLEHLDTDFGGLQLLLPEVALRKSQTVVAVLQVFLAFANYLWASEEGKWMRAACFQEILSNISNASPVDYNFIFHCISVQHQAKTYSVPNTATGL